MIDEYDDDNICIVSMSDKMKKRIGEMMGVAPWTTVNLNRDAK